METIVPGMALLTSIIATRDVNLVKLYELYNDESFFPYVSRKENIFSSIR
jgi:hypothetical protein